MAEDTPENNSLAGTMTVVESLFELVQMPVLPKIQGRKNSAGYKFYKKIRPELPAWWEEFSTAIENGTRKYPTVARFILAKTNKQQEQKWLMEMLGPAPLLDEKRDTPWLGDWYNRRLNGAWQPQQIEKIQSLITNLKEQTERIRSLKPVTIQLIARWLKMQEQVDEAFGGQMFEPDKNPIEQGNVTRAKMYHELHHMIASDVYRTIEEIMAMEGVDRHKLNPVQINTQVNQLMGDQNITTTNALTPETQTIAEVAQMLVFNQNKYKMGLPKTITGEVKSEKSEDKAKLPEFTKKERIQ